mmetsp:Transcript_63887/g.152366  ORF Transcript_63887/g.152366 Transcript_63887/m.152366 type:complete len:203 (+) Transcript_63887:471-1079(+)
MDLDRNMLVRPSSESSPVASLTLPLARLSMTASASTFSNCLSVNMSASLVDFLWPFRLPALLPPVALERLSLEPPLLLQLLPCLSTGFSSSTGMLSEEDLPCGDNVSLWASCSSSASSSWSASKPKPMLVTFEPLSCDSFSSARRFGPRRLPLPCLCFGTTSQASSAAISVDSQTGGCAIATKSNPTITPGQTRIGIEPQCS